MLPTAHHCTPQSTTVNDPQARKWPRRSTKPQVSTRVPAVEESGAPGRTARRPPRRAGLGLYRALNLAGENHVRVLRPLGIDYSGT